MTVATILLPPPRLRNSQIDSLPYTHIHPSVGNGNGETGSGNGGLGVCRHVIVTFAGMLVIGLTFSDKTVENGFHVSLYIRVGVLIYGEGCACMFDEQVQYAGLR